MNKLYFLVVGILGVVLVLGLGGVIALGLDEKNIPDVLQNVVVGALTALGTLLARPPREDEVMPVTNADSRPLLVTEPEV